MFQSNFNIVILRRIREEQPTLFPFLLEAIETREEKNAQDADFQSLLKLCEQEEWYDWCILIRDYTKESSNEILKLEKENKNNINNTNNMNNINTKTIPNKQNIKKT